MCFSVRCSLLDQRMRKQPGNKMAETRTQHEPITKGMKLTILIEEVINGVLVVLLEHGSERFRGVLFDAHKRYLHKVSRDAIFGDRFVSLNPTYFQNNFVRTSLRV